MSIRFIEEELERLYAHAKEGYPHEVVGILVGKPQSSVVSKVVPLINEREDSPANRYKVSGLTLFRKEEALRAEGMEVLGYYHTHPDHPAQYSDYDRDHALPNLSYVIVSVRDGEIADTLSWRLRDDRSSMDPESVEW